PYSPLFRSNSKELSWLPPAGPLQNTDTWPIWPFDGADGSRSRSMDCDYNRANDVLHTSPSGYRLWMLLPGGKFAKERRVAPLTFEGQVFRFDAPGTHIADLNGDRLQDLVWIQSSRVLYWASRGHGDFGDSPIVLPLCVSLSPQDVARAGFADVDGDGVVDLTVVRPSSAPSGVLYWLSRFQNGLEGPRLITGLPPQSNEDALRWADMNASGSTDIVISRPRAAAGERIVFVELVPQGKPHLLRRADNGLGQVMTIEYEPPSAQMTRAHAAGNPWTLRMPLSVTVVGRIREDDGRGTVSERVITYRDPFWDAEKQEFRGFTVADALEVGDSSAAGKLTRTEFHIGLDADCLKGKPRAEEVRGEEGELYTRTENDWDHRVLAAGDDGREVCFAFQSGFEELVVEGGISGVVLSTEL